MLFSVYFRVTLVAVYLFFIPEENRNEHDKKNTEGEKKRTGDGI